MNLLSFKRPSRYSNGELNSVHKKADIRVALAFPDVYEIGMSHLGLKVLYSIINDIPFASAERVFSPWTDMEEAMKSNGILLSSLESNLPLKDFDIVGFSLQYELSYTTVLNMLHLGGIPIRSEDRLTAMGGPIVIAGGPCTLNPFPMAAFVDAFLVGDGEDAVREVLHIYHRWKNEGEGDKTSLLKALSEIEGMFVPSLGCDRQVTRRIIPSLEAAPFPDNPVLPFASIIHDRVNIEIARGCSMGCRFCQAGMSYRPVRERSPARVLELAERSLANTGYEDISFTSLSSGDYSCLLPLMKEFNRRFAGRRVSMSLPSLRVASVNREILKEMRTVRKTGFTIAPEAGTERLRGVINKDFSEETYTRALETLFREGWNNLKLYFMTGLPTETDADIEAITAMVRQAIMISKRITGRNVNISVGVSSFVPKPHTPFQWFGQNPVEVLKEKNYFLKKAMLRMGVKYKGHEEKMSLLEAVLARGDESLAAVIENAWALGCRLDAWTEAFDFGKWEKAIEMSGINAFDFATNEHSLDAAFVWDTIQTGVTKEYLRSEYVQALSANFTSDCRKGCHGCGLDCVTTGDDPGRTEMPADTPQVEQPMTGNIQPQHSPLRSHVYPVITRERFLKVRIQYQKTGRTRYLSHLELTTALMRAMRRAAFPFRYSEGFHPAPRVSFGPALPVGVSGLRECLDLEVIPPFEIETALGDLNRTMPDGLRADRMVLLNGDEKSLNSFIARYRYEIRSEQDLSVEDFLGRDDMVIKRGNSSIWIGDMVDGLDRVDNKTFYLTVKDLGNTKVRLDEILHLLFGLPCERLFITRTEMFGWDGGWVDPMECVKVWAAKS